MNRREAIKTAALGALGAATAVANRPTAASGPTVKSGAHRTWAMGSEGQRKADLGNGTFLNPIMAGPFSDPAILKDGTSYYMTMSSFEADPGLPIWHSRDLVNWEPMTPAMPNPIGSVFAVDLVKHDRRFYIYVPFVPTAWSTALQEGTGIYVIHSDRMDGGWSRPIDLGIRGLIDPGHAVGEDGQRYLFLSGGHRVRLNADGLSTIGKVEKVYDGWKYPESWVTEAYALEGPKIFRHGDYFYLVSAVGGTAGPATGHMVIAARSRSINGPWKDCPHNPIIRTSTEAEQWWSRGHASLVEGPKGDWWIVYHGYENGFRTLGRQTLLEPIRWTDDGWFEAMGGDLSQPLPVPVRDRAVPHGIARSDDFAASSLGLRWSFHAPNAGEARRARFENASLTLEAAGTSPADSSPLTNPVGDRSYDVRVEVELLDGATGGLLLFLSNRLFVGIAIDGKELLTYAGGRKHYWREPSLPAQKIHLRIQNREHIVTYYYSPDGENWTQHGLRMETSGYNVNTTLPGEGESLRPALFAAVRGRVRFKNFQYRALT